MRLRKKVAAMALAGVIVAGHSIAVLAAVSGFSVSTPSLVYLNNKYIVSGGVSYTPTNDNPGSLYLQDMVCAYRWIDGLGNELVDYKPAYGWNSASAMTDGISKKPTQIVNIGSYKSGSSFIEVERKPVNIK